MLIKGIKWIGCGNDKEDTNQALYVQVSCDITIQNCIFQHSVGQAVVLSEVWWYILNSIGCKFVNNTHYWGHSAAVHYALNYKTECVLTISGCSFGYNGATESIAYMGHTYYKLPECICLNGSNFYNNQGVSSCLCIKLP